MNYILKFLAWIIPSYPVTILKDPPTTLSREPLSLRKEGAREDDPRDLYGQSGVTLDG